MRKWRNNIEREYKKREDIVTESGERKSGEKLVSENIIKEYKQKEERESRETKWLRK